MRAQQPAGSCAQFTSEIKLNRTIPAPSNTSSNRGSRRAAAFYFFVFNYSLHVHGPRVLSLLKKNRALYEGQLGSKSNNNNKKQSGEAQVED